jgi:hypothetical protein
MVSDIDKAKKTNTLFINWKKHIRNNFVLVNFWLKSAEMLWVHQLYGGAKISYLV